ncbi:glycerol kinase [Mesorhizobium sp. M4B.F.Ca.ET.214.01.1.1]|nr:glycerol kinase [Mesorhizobium sp. M4B.F.Ca.ET.214.01.1.1]TGQ60610.1 glycerol kinase [Mesorhizobium sp. M4B.F.Ca.ET.211.01.1.1]TGU36478.1 glycerol kinase [Mesorhizobium sp. M4B.F.Ca.ET.150.01.1.1]
MRRLSRLQTSQGRVCSVALEDGLFIGVDHGGSTVTALVFNPEDGILSCQSVPMPKTTPGPGLVEHKPDDFLMATLAAASAALKEIGREWRDVRAVGVANQGETSMAWSSETGEGLGPAISWEDRRTAEDCRELAASGVEALVRQHTGVLLDPYFSASKFRWLLQNVSEVRAAAKQGQLCLGGTDSYLLHRLTNGAVFVTEPGTASRTSLLNIREIQWDARVLDAFGLDVGCLPKIGPSCGPIGFVDHPDINAKGIEICADVVDAHAALFAQGCFDDRSAKATYGTGAFIEVNTGKRLVEPDGLLPVFVAWQMENEVEYALEGGVFSVGSALDWASRTGLISSVQDTAAIAGTVHDTGNVVFVPAFSGIAAPHWIPTGKAMLSGIGLDTSHAQIIRALLDGIAFSCAEVILALNDKLGGSLQCVKADGGPSRNPYLMQRSANVLGLPVLVSEEREMTALGAAMMAAVGAGSMTIEDVAARQRKTRVYQPSMNREDHEVAWANWKSNINAVRNLAQ